MPDVGSAYGASGVDGRLDLDDLDGATPTDLDVIGGADGPSLSERAGLALERAGLTPWIRAHRIVAATTAGALVVAIAAGGLWWVRRPAPLPDVPHVLVKASGPSPTANLEFDPVTDRVVGVFQTVHLSTAERTGVELELLHLVGPGLTAAPDRAGAALDTEHLDREAMVPATLDCASPEATTAVLGATAADYGMDLRRTAPEGETRIDRIPFIGANDLRELVRSACVQIAADRDLTVNAVDVRAVPDVVAADVDIDLTNSSVRSWPGLRVSPAAQPEVVNGGPRVDLEPGTRGHIVARLWPEDCTEPATALAMGLPVRAELGPDGSAPPAETTSPTFRLGLPATVATQVAAALRSSCTSAPRVVVDRARVRTGPGTTTAGVLDIRARIEAPRTYYVEADNVGLAVRGELVAVESPVPVLDGIATLEMRWQLPSCETLAAGPVPQAAIRLVGDGRRPDLRQPFLVALRGEQMRLTLGRLCGDEVAAIVR